MIKTRLFFILTGLLAALPVSADELQVERLTWAGVKLVLGETTVLVDAVGTDLWSGNAPEGLVPVSADTRRRYALITHAHNDHFDVETLKAVLGDRGYVICHESIATYVASRGLRVIPAREWQPVSRGGFVFTAVPAVDGFGDQQVSWVIAGGGKKIIHAGDTLWHGQWGMIGQQFGPFDLAFMPINAPVLQLDPPQETPAVLSPQQAVDAALSLRAATLVPIHFGLEDPPFYDEIDEPLNLLQEHAQRRGQAVKHLRPGDAL